MLILLKYYFLATVIKPKIKLIIFYLKFYNIFDHLMVYLLFRSC